MNYRIFVYSKAKSLMSGLLLLMLVCNQAAFLVSAQSKNRVGKARTKAELNVIDIPTDETSVIPAPDFGPLGKFRPRGEKLLAPQVASELTERESNNTSATANALSVTQARVSGMLYPNGDIDFYSFNANAGDRIFAAVMTSGSAGSSTDSQITLLASDGTTTIEFDDDNGSFAALSASIAGATIPTTGVYYLKVNDFTAGTTSERGYNLWLSVQSGPPTPEVESNDLPATATTLPSSGFVSGARNPAIATEQDWYAFNLNAGDTVFLSLDLDPERDSTTWNGRLGFALFGDAGNQTTVVDDAGTGDVSPVPNRPSEAYFMTVKNAGTYYAYVDSASAATGGPTATYNLNVTVLPKTTIGVNCTTYTSTDVPQTIGPGTGLTSSTITVPGNPRIADLDVEIQLNHAVMNEIDAHLRSPAGNDNGLFTDIGAAAVGGQSQMDAVFDDQAGITPAYTVVKGIQIRPENNATAGTASTSGAYRLGWFNGEDAGGTWTLDLRDDTAGANGGTLTGWALRICEQTPFTGQTVYSADFESGDGGFTHSGTQDEWQMGLPATAATTTANPVAQFSTCNSGVSCWKTDLTGTYNATSNQDLFSPNIDLTAYTSFAALQWAMKAQIETANFDHSFVEVQDVNNPANNRVVWEWIDPTPISASAGTGNPQVNIGGSLGWGNYRADISDFAGKVIRVRFHLDSETSVNFAGLAIDDVVVKANAFTAAHVGVGGRVVDSAGFAIPRAIVTITGADGATRSTRTNSFGYYRFDDVEVDVTYIMNASKKGYVFAPRIVSVQDEIADADFVGLE